jgi:hypothetical protein
MKRLAMLIALVAGCHGKPCATSSECGNGEVCAAAHCSALSCDQMWYATDPTTGQCTPLSGCVDPSTVANWAPCSDPCAGMSENQCLADQRCQATYTTSGGTGSCGPGALCTQPTDTFRACAPIAAPADPCTRLDDGQCASDSRCELSPTPTGSGCLCAASPDGGACDCPPPPPVQNACHLKFCGELSESQCKARPDCSTTPPVAFAQGGGGTTMGGVPTPAPAPTPKAEPFQGCFSFGGCIGADEKGCRAQRFCRPEYDDHGNFASCGNQDFTRHCGSAADCNPGERCNPSGACVIQGCAGENEAECSADPTCEPVYALQCSPYATSGGGGFCGGGVPDSRTGTVSTNEAPAPGSCTCEPSFAGCEPHGPGCDPGKSVLVRDPAILDDPFWAFDRVLAAVTGAGANDVADAWLPTLGVDTVVDGKTASGRPGAAAFIAALPHGSDGKIDASKIGLVPTSLSNRLDLADGQSCGEARITYALSTGATDRRHRMTIIVELRQPYDNAGCRPTARSWVALSSLDGAALQAALQAIYTPLLTPANLKQIRTNEFLVGPQDFSQPTAVWELREFHVGTDARLHQALLPLQIDQTAASDASFVTWAQANRTGLTNGTVTFPAQYRVPTATEDGAQIGVADPSLTALVNQQTCAGCHTTSTNSAFAHVAERRNPAWRAEISQFLESQLRIRAAHVLNVAFDRTNAVLDVRPMH